MNTILNDMAKASVVLVCSIVQIVSLTFRGIAWVFTKGSDLMVMAIAKLRTAARQKLGTYEL